MNNRELPSLKMSGLSQEDIDMMEKSAVEHENAARRVSQAFGGNNLADYLDAEEKIRAALINEREITVGELSELIKIIRRSPFTPPVSTINRHLQSRGMKIIKDTTIK